MVFLTSCQGNFKVYSIVFDLIEVNNNIPNLSIKEIDFRYLDKENKVFNKIVFYLNPLETFFLINKEK